MMLPMVSPRPLPTASDKIRRAQFQILEENLVERIVVILARVDQKLIKSANNIPGVKTAQVNTINVYDILNADKLIVLKDAVAKIEEVYA